MFHGGAPHLQFWQALDTALDRQVALTFVDPDGALPDEDPEILARTLRLSRIDKPGIARVLDVVHTGTGGLVVSEWVRGGSLQEVADTSPSPVGAVARHAVAGRGRRRRPPRRRRTVDRPPSRVRVSIEGDVVLAFPATMPDANPEDDIRGIGAALYALLVNRWPLPETGVRSGLAPADAIPPVNPSSPVRSTATSPSRSPRPPSDAIQEDGGIRSASTLLNLLQQATAVADRTEFLGPIDENHLRPRPAPAATHRRLDEEQARLRRRRAITSGSAPAPPSSWWPCWSWPRS